jgi:hypothetical protein
MIEIHKVSVTKLYNPAIKYSSHTTKLFYYYSRVKNKLLNMPPVTKIDCETKNHLSLRETLVISNCYN